VLLAEGGVVIPHEEGALRKALGELLQNEALRERLGRKAMAAAGTIGWEGPVQEAEALYRKLAEKQ
jgi:glycosyltransferase involved in cell wall biosynthesis